MTDPAFSPVTGTRRVAMTFTHRVAPHDLDDRRGGGASFLAVLARRFPYLTAPQWAERIRDGRVTLNTALATPETPVHRGDLITSHITGYEEPAVPTGFRELAASGDLALVHKPAGLPVHKTGRIFVNVLANLYRASKDDDAWSPLNRLDVETGGIVAFARGREALRRFAPGAPGTTWTKRYLAVIDGLMENPCAHTGPLAEWSEHPIRSRMRVHPEGKAARTEFTPLATHGGKTLVLAQPVTGRKHQIRAHLADLGFPIVGDKVYHHEGRYYLQRVNGGELTAEDHAVLGAPHQLLHAVGLCIANTDNVGGDGTSQGVAASSEVAGIAGWDFDLPEDFRRYFPDTTESWLRERLSVTGEDQAGPVTRGA